LNTTGSRFRNFNQLYLCLTGRHCDTN